MTAREDQVRSAHAAWIAAVNGRDLDALLAAMADDVVFLNPGAPPLDRDSFRPRFLEGHRLNEIRCTSELLEVEVVGDVAITRCRDALSVAPRDGAAPFAMAGERLTVYRRQADGRWLLARDANTLTVVAG